MRSINSIYCLIPLLGLVMVSTPTVGEDSTVQGEGPPRVAPDPGEAPGLTNARGASVIEVFKGSQVERVDVSSGDYTTAVDGQPAGSAEGLRDTVELVKGGEIVVLTVVPSEPSVPISARVDSIKGQRGGPTSLLPFQSQINGTARPDGPTSLIPSNPPATGKEIRRAPVNLIPSQPQVREAAFRGGSTGPIPLQPQATGTTLEDQSAQSNRVPPPVASAELRAGPTDDGVLVASVEQGSQAWRDGLRQGDVITSVNRKPVRDMTALETELESGNHTVVLEVRRGVKEIIVVLRR